MRHTLNLICALYVTGCGVDPATLTPAETTSPASQTSASKGTLNQASEANKPQTNQNQDTASPEVISFAVADHKALPTCEPARDTQLAYVRSEKTFYVCDVKEWVAIDIRGQDGKDGKDGVSPEPLAAAPVTTVVQKPPRTLGPREFVDSFTGLTWTKATTEVLFATAKIVCSNGWRLPTELELELAIARGTLTTTITAVWADSGRAGWKSSPIIIDVEPTDKAYPHCILVE